MEHSVPTGSADWSGCTWPLNYSWNKNLILFLFAACLNEPAKMYHCCLQCQNVPAKREICVPLLSAMCPQIPAIAPELSKWTSGSCVVQPPRNLTLHVVKGKMHARWMASRDMCPSILDQHFARLKFCTHPIGFGLLTSRAWVLLEGSILSVLSVTLCSDITNTLVGISGETVPKGGNLHIYWPSNHAIWWAVVLNSQLVCHTTLLPW